MKRSAPEPGQEYILGTRDDEIERLGLQHRVWRPHVLACWSRAGITTGSRVLDVGAGPGYATVDLAEIVGPDGGVAALERSAPFVAAAREACARRGLAHVELHEIDLMAEWPDLSRFDAAWCRWVAAFVSSPERLVRRMAGALRPGGVAIFHEYASYETWRLAPRGPGLESFVEKVVRSWRASGGEPNIGLDLPRLLRAAGLEPVHLAPLLFVVRPGDSMWRWCAAFIETHLRRELEAGHFERAWADSVGSELQAAEADPASYMITPLVIEIIARRPG
jgi:protein-L-isoaspartate O-methyltransferase